mgnify:CR=1 FL=1
MRIPSFIASIALSLTTSLATATEYTIVGNYDKAPKISSQRGYPEGILVEILKYAEQRMSHRFNIELYPWARSYKTAMGCKENTGIIGLSITEDRKRTFDYSTALFYDEVIIVTRKGQEFPYQQPTDLAGKKVATCYTCVYGEAFQKASKQFTMTYDRDRLQRLRLLKSGRIDVALFSPGYSSLQLTLDQAPDLTAEDFSVLPVPLVRDSNHLAFHKDLNQTAFLREFDKVIAQGYANDEIPRLIFNYLQSNSR